MLRENRRANVTEILERFGHLLPEEFIRETRLHAVSSLGPCNIEVLLLCQAETPFQRANVMKIAIITTSFPSLSETFVLDQITGLLDLGHDVHICLATRRIRRAEKVAAVVSGTERVTFPRCPP